MPWDWTSFPEYLDSVDRAPKAINILPYVPLAPMLISVLGLEDAKAGKMPTDAQHAELARIVRGGIGRGRLRLVDPAAAAQWPARPCSPITTARRWSPT